MKALIDSVSLLIHAVSNGDTKTEKNADNAAQCHVVLCFTW